ncbi:type II secretion system protein [Campylobacter gracilis]|uniref:type II secretion system protein n=1 Tax=Campylobacter gracilis TaxID=824 RepID=UPI0026E94F4B|nr:prepilin-type N-terminal cleavage/methylation domain-containing protein [Campylobacter gracilis]
MKNLKAFTMIELVFVIVVLGILAGIAVPRLAATRDDATIAKMRGDVAAIRSGISLVRSENMMRGVTTWPDLEAATDDTTKLFENILQNPIYPKTGCGASPNVTINGWCAGVANTSYWACVGRACTQFTYVQNSAAIPAGRNLGSFDCNHQDDLCQKIAQ